MDLEKGGRAAIERMVEAYGYTTRQALCDHLGVSKSTLATRYMRDSFPSEWVIQCALETSVSLKWLVTGEGAMFTPDKSDIAFIETKKIIDGALLDSGHRLFDRALLPTNTTSLLLIEDKDATYIVDKEFNEITDGTWLINLDEKISIRNIARLPNNKIRVSNDSVTFDCLINDITPLARVIKSII